MLRAALRRALLGFLVGALGGGVALMIALGRAGLVQSGGHGPTSFNEQHPALAVALLAAFGICGAVVGLLAPMRRTPFGAIGLGLIAANGFLTTVFVALEGPPAGWPRSMWWALGVGTLLLGLVLGGQLQPSDS
jgi:hypothetical protein